MSEALAQFHLLRPWWLLALLGLPLAMWQVQRAGGGTRALSRLVDMDLLPALLTGRQGSRSVAQALLIGGWLLATLAFAGPTWSRVSEPLYAQRAAQVVAISLSQHMLARDVAPSRVDRARLKARELLAANQGGQNALIAYAGQSFVVAPLTADAHSLDELLDALSPDTMPVDGDNAAAAIAQAVSLIKQAKAGGGSLVLITDHADADADAAARAARAAGLRVSVLGVGTARGGPIPMDDGSFLRNDAGQLVSAPLDATGLRALAAAGGGRYAPMSTATNDIDALRGELKTQRTRSNGVSRSDQWLDQGPWLVLPLLLIVAMAFRRGWLLLALPLLVLPLVPTSARAGTWDQLWQRPDQRAAKALNQGHADVASALARDPALRGAAQYRSGDYAKAAQSLRSLATTDAQYNRGNALARQGEYQPAIAAYDKALKLDPGNADATANRKAVQDWLRQQKPPPSSKDAPQNAKPNSGDKGKQNPKDGAGKSGQNNPPDQQKSPGDKPGDPKNQDSSQAGQKPLPNDQSSPSPGEGDKPPTPAEKAAEQAKTEQAQQALKKQMDQAMAQRKAKGESQKNQPHQLGLPDQDDPTAKLPDDLRKALQRVPDDPGSLLRRKFQLEYLRRQGALPPDDGP